MSVDERKKQILHAVIKDYVATAEPVGSRTLVKKYNLGVSPATIRNEMSDLEDLGYIKPVSYTHLDVYKRQVPATTSDHQLARIS